MELLTRLDGFRLSLVRAEFFRYFLVSLVAFFADYSLFWSSLRVLGFGWALSASVGFVFGVVVAYILSVFWVFRFRVYESNYAKEFLAFFLIGVFGLLVTQASLWVGIYKAELTPERSRLLAAGITFAFNFIVRKIFLFVRKL